MVEKRMRPVSELLWSAYVRVLTHGRDRGDVPGWVLVTIMTAGLVTAIWVVADDRLTELFNNALDGVAGSSP